MYLKPLQPKGKGCSNESLGNKEKEDLKLEIEAYNFLVWNAYQALSIIAKEFIFPAKTIDLIHITISLNIEVASKPINVFRVINPSYSLIVSYFATLDYFMFSNLLLCMCVTSQFHLTLSKS